MATGTEEQAAAPAPDLRATGERIDALLDASATGGIVARERAEELVRLVTDLYGAGLERLLELLHEAGRLDEEVLDLLAGDDLVASLLLVHGLHPYSVQSRVQDALDRVRPYLGSHGGDVELLEVTDDGAVRLRLLGSCDGCASSAVTLELAVQGAIEAAAPEVTAIEVEATAAPDHAHPLIPVESLRSRLDETATIDPNPSAAPVDTRGGWHPVPELATLAPGAVTTVVVAQCPLLVCRVGTALFAFHDRCARCAASLAGATLARKMGGAAGDAVLRCPACQAHYDVRRAGGCLDVPELHLDPLPLLTDGPEVSVAVPTPVHT